MSVVEIDIRKQDMNGTKGKASNGRRPRILALANQKGGVGKTTTAINLATALVAIGQKVLLLDMDPQSNASTGLGCQANDTQPTTYELLGDASLADAIMETAIPNLSLVPAVPQLAGAELELVDMPRREFRLRDAIADADPDIDYILIDCPPALGLLTLNALTAADGVLVPLQCEYFALEGLGQLLQTVDRVRGQFNPDLELQGVLLTMYDKRNRLSDQVATDVREHLGDQVYQTVIPRNVRVSEAPSHGTPALIYDHRCAGSQAYMRLASELLKREGIQVAA